MTQDELIYRMNRGDILPGLIPVHDNVFDIPRRLKEIDPGYFVMFNPADQRYELHHEAQDFTYCLTFPYEELDGRALDYVRETRIERIDTIKQQMDEHNRKLEEGYRKERDNQIECLAKDVHKFALRHEDDIQQKAFAETVKPKEVE
jgi:hypothetical protein